MKNELKRLIATNIAEQGNQVDAGGNLPVILNAIIDKAFPGFLSLERLRKYLYRVTFDSVPDNDGQYSPIVGGCSAYVKDGKLYRNLDFYYDNAASFIVRTPDFEGMAFITGLNDGEIREDTVNQLPYRVVDGCNNNGIMVSTHIVYNDWSWNGAGQKNIPLNELPYRILTNVKSMATIVQDLAGIIDNLAYVPGMGEYLLQVLVTDGATTYAVLPPTDGGAFVLQDISAYPKLTNFRWVASETVVRTDLQRRPTGVERFNLMPCALSDLAFTKAYESTARLSEFIGIDETTKDSTDAELTAIYNRAHALYENRKRDGETWQTMHSVIYGNGMLSLYIQENWDDDCLAVAAGQIGSLADLETEDKSSIVAAINELAGKINAI